MIWEKSFIPRLSHLPYLEHSHKIFGIHWASCMKVTLQVKARSIWKELLKIHKEIDSIFIIEHNSFPYDLTIFLWRCKAISDVFSQMASKALQRLISLQLLSLQLEYNPGTQEVVKMVKKNYHMELLTRKLRNVPFAYYHFSVYTWCAEERLHAQLCLLTAAISISNTLNNLLF